MKRPVLVFTLLFCAVFNCLSFCQSTPEGQAAVVRGQISSIDWAASTVTIRWLQIEGYVSYDEIAIFIPRAAAISKGSKQIGFTELHVGDQVTAEYIDTSPGPLKMVKMLVLVP